MGHKKAPYQLQQILGNRLAMSQVIGGIPVLVPVLWPLRFGGISDCRVVAQLRGVQAPLRRRVTSSLNFYNLAHSSESVASQLSPAPTHCVQPLSRVADCSFFQHRIVIK